MHFGDSYVKGHKKHQLKGILVDIQTQLDLSVLQITVLYTFHNFLYPFWINSFVCKKLHNKPVKLEIDVDLTTNALSIPITWLQNKSCYGK